MPDITQRIADILRRIDEESTGGDLSSRSSTGPEQWAEVLTTELGLTQQWGVEVRTGDPDYDVREAYRLPVKSREDAEMVIARASDVRELRSRYVTDWVCE